MVKHHMPLRKNNFIFQSTSVTDKAFYKQWYNCDLWSQRTFSKMMISKKFECRLTAFGTVDLTIKTFTMVNTQIKIFY